MKANIKFLNYGEDFFQWVKVIQLKGLNLDAEQIERVCSNLRIRYGVPAIPYSRIKNEQSIIAIATNNLTSTKIKEGEWETELIDNDDKYKFNVRNNGHLLRKLMSRSLYCHLEKNTSFWRLDSPRIWYESKPFERDKDIAAYYKYEIADNLIKGKGIGISVRVSVSFFTLKSVHHYFSTGQAERFYALSQRQEDGERQFKATLLYNLGNKKQKCYFVDYINGQTLCDSGRITISKDENYEHLYDYYRSYYPNLRFNEDEIIAKVSFPSNNNTSAKPVTAERLYLRVMNDSLGRKLKNVDKIIPDKRKWLRNQFWQQVGKHPFNHSSASIQKKEWAIDESRFLQFALPNILAHNSKKTLSPTEKSRKHYKNYFWQKKKLIDENGCFHVPEGIHRKIYFAFPKEVHPNLRNGFVKDITAKVSALTRKQITGEQLQPFDSHLEAIHELKREADRGMVVFVMNHEPAIYFDIEYNLKAYSLKRITQKTLIKKNRDNAKWESFIDICAYDIVKQLNCLLFKVDLETTYDGALMIDVGEKSKNWGLSLFINSTGRKAIPLKIADTRPKKERRETINPTILKRRIIELGRKAKISGGRLKPLKKLVVLRDGRVCGNEPTAIIDSFDALKEIGLLANDVEVAIVDIHKTSNTGITLYQDISKNGEVRAENVFEGTAVLLDSKRVVLSNTGITLPMLGTAKPIILESKQEDTDLIELAYYVFILAQYNLGNPLVAQRLPYPVKDLDELLRKKAAQLVNKIA